MEQTDKYSKSKNKRIIIIGGGPAGIACAYFIKLKKPEYQVILVEKNKSIGRKILIAGDGGLNLTHNESQANFVSKYTPENVRPYVHAFGNLDLQVWLKSLGLDLFVGSSNRVFPTKNWKPIQVVNLFQRYLEQHGVELMLNQEVVHLSSGKVKLKSGEQLLADYIVLASGSPAWVSDFQMPNLGSKIKLNPFAANNAKLWVSESNVLEGMEGEVLKYVQLNYKDFSFQGDINIGNQSLESTPIYAFCNAYRSDFQGDEFTLDLIPQRNKEWLLDKIKYTKSRNAFFEGIKLGKVKKKLLKQYLSKEAFFQDDELVKALKQFKLHVQYFDDVKNAISASGGIPMEELSADLELKKMKGVFVAGELIDWYAPTGGYLLTMCFSMGKWIADHITSKGLE